MKDKNIHIKIEEALNSLDSIKRAEANPFLFTRVMEKMQSQTYQLVKPVLIWQMAVSLIVIISLNILVSVYTTKKMELSSPSAESGYFSNNSYTY